MLQRKYKAVAHYIIKKKKNISLLELLKLSYISHGYCLAIKNKTLLDCKIEAWPKGPVPVKMYQLIKKNNTTDVMQKDIKQRYQLKNYEKEILNAVMEKYQHKAAHELSDLTHNENTPWTKTVKNYGFYANITNKLIKNYYKNSI